jgi:hypothetical protein
MPNRSSLLHAIFALISLGFVLAAVHQPASAQAGVQVVKNPKKPRAVAGQPSSLTLKQDLVIGLTGGPEGDLFAELRSVGVDDQENIWTLDWEDIKVRIFDKTGKPLITFGKKGQGPKELQNPVRMIVSGDGTAAIMDLNKLAFYSRDGQCVKELSLSRTSSFRMKFDRKGFIYLDSWDYGPDPATKTVKQTWKVTKYDGDLKPLKVIPIHDEPATMGSLNLFTPILYFHVTKDERIIWAIAYKPEYEFTVLDPDGKPIRRIIKDYEPRRITSAEEKDLMKERFGDRQIPAGMKIVIPPAHPPLQHFVGDDDGRIYARTTDPDGKGGTYIDVFDPEGRYIARTSLPEDETIFIVKNDKLYVLLSEDAEGRPLVKRYAMLWGRDTLSPNGGRVSRPPDS